MNAMDVAGMQRQLRALQRAERAEADVFIEQSLKISARYADSRVVDLVLTTTSGTATRLTSEHTERYFSASGLSSDAQAAVDSVADHDALADDYDARIRQLAAAADKAARDADARITQVLIDAEVGHQLVIVVTPDGAVVDQRPLAYLTMRAVARQKGTMATGFITPATSRPDLDLDAADAGLQAAERALAGLAARPAPIRHMPVVIGPGRGMVLIHEACCHPLEGDEVSRGSVYANRLGDRVAAQGVSIADDPTLDGAAGSYQFDDEGLPATRTTLVAHGELRSFLTDRAAARRLGVRPTPNARRASHRHVCLPRMSNTCVLPGPSSAADIVASTRNGLYALHVGGGEVVESTGEFVFRVMNGYLIENGRVTDPVSETTVSGNGADVLMSIDAVGNDPAVGAAKCGKFGQGVAVGVSGPTVRISSVLVGGTAS